MIFRAGVVPLNVVAAKKPGHWIVRAFAPFVGMTTLLYCVREHTGTLDPEIEWTGFRYQGMPSYLVYGSGDLDGTGQRHGVYRFGHKGGGCYGPAERLGDVW